MTENVKRFKETLDGAISFIEGIVPQELQKEYILEIEQSRAKVNLALRVNPRDSISFIMDTISEHAEEILVGDDKYFMGKNAEELQIESNGYLMLMDHIKNLWVKCNAEEKTSIKNYIKMLLMLGTLITKNETTLAIINKHRDPSNPLKF